MAKKRCVPISSVICLFPLVLWGDFGGFEQVRLGAGRARVESAADLHVFIVSLYWKCLPQLLCTHRVLSVAFSVLTGLSSWVFKTQRPTVVTGSFV